MAYEATGATALDYSEGRCGPGMYKPFANSSCQALPWGLRAPEYGTSTSDSPFDANVGYSRGIQDFSGGSCGSGMIKPGPTQPCQVIQQGMAMGSFSELASKYGKTVGWGLAVAIGVGIGMKLYKRHIQKTARKIVPIA